MWPFGSSSSSSLSEKNQTTSDHERESQRVVGFDFSSSPPIAEEEGGGGDMEGGYGSFQHAAAAGKRSVNSEAAEDSTTATTALLSDQQQQQQQNYFSSYYQSSASSNKDDEKDGLLRTSDHNSTNHNHNNNDMEDGTCSEHSTGRVSVYLPVIKQVIYLPSIRRVALFLSLYMNIAITVAKLVAYLSTWSLSVLAALLDSVLDVVSQVVLNYTEAHSSMSRSSALYPAGASRLEPIGVLTCAALMGMASFEVLKESITSLCYPATSKGRLLDNNNMSSFYSMAAIVFIKLFLLWLCNVGAKKKVVRLSSSNRGGGNAKQDEEEEEEEEEEEDIASNTALGDDETPTITGGGKDPNEDPKAAAPSKSSRAVVQLADPTLEALAQDHWNDALSNSVAAVALLFALREPSLWFLDPVGAILISLYIIHSWYLTGKEQIQHLTGRSAPEEMIEELIYIANSVDDRIEVDTVRAYHFGPKFLVEIEVVMPHETVLRDSHDAGMEIQYEIESREEVERCFVHIDYQSRPYDEHVVSKVPELREKYRPGQQARRSGSSV